MKTIGLIGGMSWESTTTYYRLLNEMIRDRLGGLHSARLVLWSFDFAEIARLQAEGDWATATRLMIRAAESVRDAGAELLAICTNTMHKMADEVESASGLPLVHIADGLAEAALTRGVKRIGLLATRFTMEQDFYTARLLQRGVEVLTPHAEDRQAVHDVIYDELCRGVVLPGSRLRYLEVCDSLVKRGAQGVALGCTEIGMLLRNDDLDVPVFDTTALHAAAIVEAALAD